MTYNAINHSTSLLKQENPDLHKEVLHTLRNHLGQGLWTRKRNHQTSFVSWLSKVTLHHQRPRPLQSEVPVKEEVTGSHQHLLQDRNDTAVFGLEENPLPHAHDVKDEQQTRAPLRATKRRGRTQIIEDSESDEAIVLVQWDDNFIISAESNLE